MKIPLCTYCGELPRVDWHDGFCAVECACGARGPAFGDELTPERTRELAAIMGWSLLITRGLPTDGAGGRVRRRRNVKVEIVPAPGDLCGNTKILPDGGPCPGCRACC